MGLVLVHMLACKLVAPKETDLSELPAHYTEDGFKNPHLGEISKSPIEFLWMKYFGDEPFSDQSLEAHLVEIAETNHTLIQAELGLPRITWIGHSTFLIQHRGINILTDPIFSKRASPVSFAGPERLVKLPIDIDELPAIDYVVISHNHYDHLDVESVRALAEQAHFLVPLKLKEWFVELGVAENRVMEFDWWDEQAFPGIRVVATPSQHWSARGPFDRNRTLWASWYIELDDLSLWFAGDTGYNTMQFREIGQRFPGIDIGLIPIGAYAPRWFMGPQHVNPEEAVRIHQDIGAKRSYGMHWGTFQLTAEPIMQPKERLALALAESKLNADEFLSLAIGQTIEVDFH